MDEGVNVLPDRVLDAVLDQVPATPQRRAGWLARRFPIMNSNTFRFAVAVAAVIVVAFIGIRFLPGIGSFGGPPAATATPIPTPVPLLKGQVPLPAGRYRLDPSLPMNVTVQVPAGWSGDTWVVVGPNGNAAPNGMAIRFYVAQDLYANPLSPNDGVMSPAVGPSVDDLVNAMVNHPDWTTTGPTAITIDGFAGKVVHVTLPAATSDKTPFYLSVDASGGQVWGWAAGQLFDIYVVDVGGKRLVIDAFHYPNTTAADVAAQTAVINTIQLAP
jgi:hypothetical protein